MRIIWKDINIILVLCAHDQHDHVDPSRLNLETGDATDQLNFLRICGMLPRSFNCGADPKFNARKASAPVSSPAILSYFQRRLREKRRNQVLPEFQGAFLSFLRIPILMLRSIGQGFVSGPV